MNDLEYQSTLVDRIAKIQAINEQYDLLNNSYISFSGGKDSCIVSELIDIALPNNRIPRLHINTGVEYRYITEYVKERAKEDDRFIIINSSVNIKRMLEADGYPFKSKQHSHNWMIYKNNEKEASRYFKMIEKDKSLLVDVNFVSQLPKGIKTNVKYVYGIREKELPTRNTEQSVRERESIIYEYQKLPWLIEISIWGKIKF